MIPKIIHYCWFGGNPLPELAQRCIASWKKYCSEYEIKEWNENNFDLDCCPFVREAYEARKWAFVSDAARLKIIYDEGGIYLDTDVEVIKSFNNLLMNRCFLGEETSGFVATGLGFGAEKGNIVVKEMLEMYTEKHFKLEDGTYDMVPCPEKNTEPLKRKGYKFSGKEIWKNEYVMVYPPEYFCPLNYDTGEKTITANTYSIHLYNASWHTWVEDVIASIEQNRVGTDSLEYKLRRCASFPFRVINKISHIGLKKAWICALKKLKERFSKHEKL